MDKVLLFIGTVAAVASGFSMPLMVIFFGRITDSMVNNNVASYYNMTAFCKNHGGAPGTTVGPIIPSTTYVLSISVAIIMIANVIGRFSWELRMIRRLLMHFPWSQYYCNFHQLTKCIDLTFALLRPWSTLTMH